MTFPSATLAAETARDAMAASIELPGLGILRIYSRHTDPMGRNLRFWLAFQPVGNPIGGQVYYRKNGRFGPPAGQKLVKEWADWKPAYKTALAISKNYEP